MILRTHQIYKTALRRRRLLFLWRFGPFLGHRLPCCCCFKADKMLLFEDISPKLNPRPGRPGCLCPTPRSKPFRLGWAYCRWQSSLSCITSQNVTVYFVVDTLLHNCTSDLHPEVALLNVPEADCPCCSFPQSVQEHFRLIDGAKLTSASSFHRLSNFLFTDPSNIRRYLVGDVDIIVK